MRYEHLDTCTNDVCTELSISSLSCFSYERNLFYPKGIKFFSLAAFLLFFCSGAPACWHMDEGGRNRTGGNAGRGMFIDFSCFGETCLLLMKEMMETKFSCQVTFHHRSSKNIKFYISASRAQPTAHLIFVA